MATNQTAQVAWLTGAAKDDVETLLAGASGALTATSFSVASLLANDPGSASFYGIYGTATPYSNASTKTPLGPSAVAKTLLGGQVSWNKSTGMIDYTPPSSATNDVLKALPAGATINDTFYYVIWMGNKGAYSLAKATIALTGIDDAATITGDITGSVIEDTTTIAGGHLSIVDPDTGESAFNAASIAGSYGTLTLTPGSTGSGATPGTGTWSYSLDHDLANPLAQGEVQTETFTLHSKGGTAFTITITVTGTNDAPTAVADVATTGENTPVAIDAITNDTDPDHNHVLSLVSVSAPAHSGSATIVGGQVVFDPGTSFDHLAQGDSATVTLDYVMTDEHGATSESTITITVTGENDAPTAVADTVTIDQDQAIALDPTANDTDPDDHHVLSLVSVSAAPIGEGTATIENGQVKFDPGTDFDHLAQGDTATVTLDYVMQDEHGATSGSTITITVTGENDAPTAVADTASTDEDHAVTIDALLNDTDPDDHHVLSLVSVSAPTGQGTATIENGHVTFDPGTDFQHLAAGASATVTLSYTMQDEFGAQSSSTIQVSVAGVNDAATISGNATGSVTEDATLTTGGTLHVTDVDDGEAQFATVDASALAGTFGDFSFDTATGQWGYTLRNGDANVQALNAGDHPTDTLTVLSLDGTASQEIVVTVNGADENPSVTWMVNHGLSTINDRNKFVGFDFNDVLKYAGDLAYDGYSVGDVTGDQVADTVVHFHYIAGNGVSGNANAGANGNGAGIGNGFTLLDVVLVGYSTFDPATQLNPVPA